MARRKTAQDYYDRHAGRYDPAYETPYWRLVRQIVRQRVRAVLPRTQPARLLDLGAGTGRWGLELARARFHVTLVDISAKMLDVARKQAETLGVTEQVDFLHADVCDLAVLPDRAFDMAVAIGDVFSFCSDARRAFREVARLLKPAAPFVLTVDNRAAGFEAHLAHKDLDGLVALIEHGNGEWLAHQSEERFATHAFDPDELRRLLTRTGFSVERLCGLTVLPLRRHQEILDEEAADRRLLQLELRLHERPDLLGLAAHLLCSARRAQAVDNDGADDSPSLSNGRN